MAESLANTDRVVLRVLAGKEFPERSGGTCNPCVKVTFGAETTFTKTLSRTRSPKWLSEAPMIFTGIANSGEGHIVATVLHKNISIGNFEEIGKVIINLANAMHSPGVEVDDWFPLTRATKVGGADAVGHLRVRVTYFLQDSFPGSDIEETRHEDSLVQNTPNCLKIKVCSAKNLRAVDNTGACNAYVTVSCSGEKVATTVVKGTDPKFDQCFGIPVSSGTSCIEIKVKHKGSYGRQVLGAAKIPMVDVARGGLEEISRRLPLLSSQSQFESGDRSRGEIELTLAWVFDDMYRGSTGSTFSPFARLKNSWKSSGDASHAAAIAAAKESAKEGEFSDENEDGDYLPLSLREQEELAALRAERLVEAKEQVELFEANTSSVKQGDYVVLVHVIEAQDLKAEGSGGTSNPYVRASCMGQRQKTSVRKGTNTCVFNEKLFFNFKDVNPAQLREADIVLSVESRNSLTTPCIGKYSLNLLNVYGQKDHEYYDQWVALSDPTDKNDKGVMGYMKISITVLGPGDAHKTHDPEKEYLEAKEAESLTDSLPRKQKAVLTPASIQQELRFLVVSVFEAQDLPMMDRHTRGGIGGKGIDAFVKCEFAGNPALKTKVVNARGATGLNVEFNEQLWIPFFFPTMANSVALSVWDRDIFAPNKCVAHTYFDLKSLPKIPQPRGGMFSSSKFDGPPPTWVNLYGAAADLRGSKAGRFENTYPDLASTFRGRLLVAMHVYTQPPRSEPEHIHKKALPDIPQDLYPKMMTYTFRASVLLGSELPMFSALMSGATTPAQLRVVVEFGPQRFVFSARPVTRGRATWVETKEQRSIELPVKIDLLPDVGVYLCRGGESSLSTVSYARVPAANFLAESFQGEPFWQKLHPDASRRPGKLGLKDSQYPGALLMRVGVGMDADGREHKWADDGKIVKDTQPCRIRVHVYQGRNLPSGDPNGLLDPYVKVWFCGVKQKTRIKHDTTSPLFYETLEFDEELPKDLRFAPEVVLQVWDSDAPPPLGRNSQVGLARFDLQNAKATSAAMQGTGPKTPVWIPIDDSHGTPTGGALLISVHIVKKRNASDKIEAPPSIQPATRRAYLEVTSLGVRNMRRFQRSHIQAPYVQFDLPGPHEDSSFSTSSSKLPRGRDANFLTQSVLPVQIAENPLFSPQLEIRVFDRRLGGLDTPVVGAASVSLHQFLPWNRDDYIAPQSQLFDPLVVATLDTADMFDRGEEEGLFLNEQPREAALKLKFATARQHGYSEEGSDSEGVDGGIGAFPEAEKLVPLPPDDTGDVEVDTFLEVEEAEESRFSSWWPWARGGGPDDSNLGGSEELDPQRLGISFPTSWAEAKYMEGRSWWLDDDSDPSKSKELESYLETMPFEHYPLLRGIYHHNSSKNTVRVVGTFKGMIRVTEDDPRRSPLVDMKTVEKIEQVKVRVYVLRGKNLQPVGGGLSDPYIRLRLGGETITSDLSSMVESTTDPSFYKAYELETSIPGLTSLEIELRDFQKNPLLNHELIGSTLIDLEDRWFHHKWQALGHPGAPGYVEDYEGPRSLLKPLESRRLFIPGSDVSQGQLDMWLEIVPQQKARWAPQTILQKPETKKFELRIVCWKAEGIPKKCGQDFYARFKMRLPQGNINKSTDTHLACKDGSPSWNWRVVIPIELPLRDPLQARLTVQLWDFDLVSSNDIVAERNIDLYQWFLMAYHSGEEILPYKIMRKVKEEQDKKTDNDSGGEEEEDGRLRVSGQRSYATMPGDDHGRDLESDQRNPLLKNEADSDEERPDDDAEMAKDAWSDLLNLVGLGPLADDAMWLNLAYYSQKKKKTSQRGRIALSIAIVPEAECESRPAGSGRREPNANPYLPPPVGRLSFFVNPGKLICSFCPTGLLCFLGTMTGISTVLLIVFYVGNYFVIFDTWKSD